MPALRLRGRLPSPFDCQRMFGKVNIVEDPGGRAGEETGLRPFGCGRRLVPANPHKLPDSVLLSQRHEGERCPQGNCEIRKIKAAGRTYYCPANRRRGY